MKVSNVLFDPSPNTTFARLTFSNPRKMTFCELRCGQEVAKSKNPEAMDTFRKRIFSRITTFKIIQLVLASGGMSLHIWQPFYRTLADSSLVPGILGAFCLVSAVLLLGQLFNFATPTRLNATFSIVAALGYGCCMSSIMDSVRHEADTKSWTFLLGKGIICFAALAVHLLELLHAFITRDTRLSNLKSNIPSPTGSRIETFQPMGPVI